MENDMNRDDLWKEWLKNEIRKDYIQRIIEQAEREEKNFIVSPDRELWFQSLEFPSFTKIHTIIIGNQPYHESALADGFAFSSLDDGDVWMRKLHQKIYIDTGMQYDQWDCTKNRWLDRGILCFPMELTQISGKWNQERNLWRPFTTTVLRKFIEDIQLRAFVFLDRYSSNTPNLFYDKPSWPHLCIQSDMRYPDFMTTPIFIRVSDFVRKNYEIEIDWT
jgi:uracil-DNA glycosylase